MQPSQRSQHDIGQHGHVGATSADTRPYPRVNFMQKCVDTGGGCCANPLSYTRHGFEEHMGVNHFGYAALVDALLPKLKSQVRSCIRQCSGMSDLMHGSFKAGRTA